MPACFDNLDGRGMLVVSVARRLGSESPLLAYFVARSNRAGPQKGRRGSAKLTMPSFRIAGKRNRPIGGRVANALRAQYFVSDLIAFPGIATAWSATCSITSALRLPVRSRRQIFGSAGELPHAGHLFDQARIIVFNARRVASMPPSSAATAFPLPRWPSLLIRSPIS